MDLAVPDDLGIILEESEKKSLDFAWELKKTIEYEGENYTNFGWCFWYSHQRIIRGTGGIEN